MKATLHALAVVAFVASAGCAANAQTDNATGNQPYLSKAMPGEWRASKLVGVAIYGPDDRLIGKVSDLLIDGSGSAKAVVVGVGGFLGVGEKDVALPFSEVKWSDTPVVEKMPPAAAMPSPAPSANSPMANSKAPPLVATPLPGSAAVPPPRTGVYDYPDHGKVNMTKEQLKSAPDFHYASGKS